MDKDDDDNNNNNDTSVSVDLAAASRRVQMTGQVVQLVHRSSTSRHDDDEERTALPPPLPPARRTSQSKRPMVWGTHSTGGSLLDDDDGDSDDDIYKKLGQEEERGLQTSNTSLDPHDLDEASSIESSILIPVEAMSNMIQQKVEEVGDNDDDNNNVENTRALNVNFAPVAAADTTEVDVSRKGHITFSESTKLDPEIPTYTINRKNSSSSPGNQRKSSTTTVTSSSRTSSSRSSSVQKMSFRQRMSRGLSSSRRTQRRSTIMFSGALQRRKSSIFMVEWMEEGNNDGENDELNICQILFQKISQIYFKNEVFILVIVVILLARIYPPLGAEYLYPNVTSTWIAVMYIFVLAGLGLKTEKFSKAFQRFKFNLFVQSFSFGCISFVVFGVTRILISMNVIDTGLANGMVVCACLPMTISSVSVLTKTSGGDEAAAVFNSAFGSFLSVFLSPTLILAYLGVNGEVNVGDIFFKLALRVVVPVLIGQVLQKKSITAVSIVSTYQIYFQKSQLYAVIWIVYTVFCKTFQSGNNASIRDIFSMILIQSLLLGFFNGLSWLLLGILYPNEPKLRIMGLFGCTQKTVAMGVPMIGAIYGDDPLVGLYTLPLLVWYPLQLVVGSFLSPRLKSFAARERWRLVIEEDRDNKDPDENTDDAVRSEGGQSDASLSLATQSDASSQIMMPSGEESGEYDEDIPGSSRRMSIFVHEADWHDDDSDESSDAGTSMDFTLFTSPLSTRSPSKSRRSSEATVRKPGPDAGEGASAVFPVAQTGPGDEESAGFRLETPDTLNDLYDPSVGATLDLKLPNLSDNNNYLLGEEEEEALGPEEGPAEDPVVETSLSVWGDPVAALFGNTMVMMDNGDDTIIFQPTVSSSLWADPSHSLINPPVSAQPSFQNSDDSVSQHQQSTTHSSSTEPPIPLNTSSRSTSRLAVPRREDDDEDDDGWLYDGGMLYE